MIVCSCNVISRSEIEQSIHDLLEQDPWRLVVPLQVYHAISKRGRCCGCFPNVTEIIVEVTERYHRARATPQGEVIDLIDRLRKQHAHSETVRVSARARASQARVA